MTGKTMKKTYTRQEAMDRLGIRSANVFFQFVRKYPDAFVIMKGSHNKNAHYDKATVDKFAERRQYFIEEKP